MKALSLATLLVLTAIQSHANAQSYVPSERPSAAVRAGLESLAKYQLVAGTYNGNVRSPLDSSVLTGLSMTLSASKMAQFSDDGKETEAVAVMNVNLKLSNKNAFFAGSVMASAGEYDSATGQLNATISIVTEANEFSNLVLSGTIEDGVFNGQIVDTEYGDYVNKVALVLGAPLADPTIDPASARAKEISDDNSSYIGKIKGSSGKSSDVELLIQQPSSSPQQSFLRLFTSRRNVLISIALNKQVGLIFTGSSTAVDNAAGTLTGTSVPTADGSTAILSCNKAADGGWDCDITSAKKKSLKNIHFAPK